MFALSTLRGRDSLLSPHMLLGGMARTEASVSMERRRRLEEDAKVMIEALSLTGFVECWFGARCGGIAETGCEVGWALWRWFGVRWALVD